MAFSRSVKDSILNFYRGTVFQAAPSGLWLALLSTAPTDDTGAGLVEITTGVWTNYARQSIGTFSAPSGTSGTRSIGNSSDVAFPAATGISGTITIVGVAYYDASTAGNFLAWDLLTNGNQGVINGVVMDFAIGTIALTES